MILTSDLGTSGSLGPGTTSSGSCVEETFSSGSKPVRFHLRCDQLARTAHSKRHLMSAVLNVMARLNQSNDDTHFQQS
ncbi:hypothetical protein KL905_002719 [Ogataea polymorpha]|nr:hypothetical protein KL937_002308 [Ogataea polymorpha]KAG7894423.1 hypothetical protein KL908_001795 [Ogataea polymorpha]KAG7897235.1 hypothetical protein KL935_005387 [Ogataea polymorpha]KAG7906823.1 hypothetical protein KL907_002463 [Ogataea polymorpha]KAG7910071.1 hypothetical protein KL906_001976 [Ogataea polymorpha]